MIHGILIQLNKFLFPEFSVKAQIVNSTSLMESLGSIGIPRDSEILTAMVLLPLAGIPATRMQAYPPKNEMKDCPDTPRVFSR